jgi:glyoxylase-like metal-dependent hydrolase (beta-lactamase superfamily II)
LLHFRYHGTNCFFVRSVLDERLLAIDAGWPETLHEYARGMKSIGCRLQDLAWSIVTHFHMDHAGLVGELIERGVSCFVFENQPDAIDAMEQTIEKNSPRYRRIEKHWLHLVATRDSRMMFEKLGIRGEVIVTDYHSPDSITFLSGEREAVIGDLPPAVQEMPGDQRFLRNWRLLRGRGVRRVFPAHAGEFDLDECGWLHP